MSSDRHWGLLCAWATVGTFFSFDPRVEPLEAFQLRRDAFQLIF